MIVRFNKIRNTYSIRPCHNKYKMVSFTINQFHNKDFLNDLKHPIFRNKLNNILYYVIYYYVYKLLLYCKYNNFFQ